MSNADDRGTDPVSKAPIVSHEQWLAARRTLLEKLEAFGQRVGRWFRWASSHGNTFNRDCQVTFTPEEVERGEEAYNYGR